jgi:hypothetical protein
VSGMVEDEKLDVQFSSSFFLLPLSSIHSLFQSTVTKCEADLRSRRQAHIMPSE